MISRILLGLFTIFALGTNAQTLFDIELDPLVITGAPNLHSFSYGKTSNGKGVFVGGRVDGLHRKQPINAFLASDNNTNIYVLDRNSSQVNSASLSVLPTSIYEHLQSTNQEFFQRGNTLYVFGGYGYSASQNDHVTFDKLTAIDVNGVADAILNNTSITSFFRQISDTNFAVSGGQVGYLDSTFYLCGGQYFKGRYNPVGPQHGPGFVQNYTNEIRRFKIVDNGTTMTVTNYNVSNDPANLHKRDFNMTPQIFPNGDKGFTMFSGVFNSNDLPWLTSVDVVGTTYTHNPNFLQYLNHYHCAKLPIFDSVNNTMHTVFFGGMSQYTLDSQGNLIKDDNVPFVKTISRVTRLSNGTMQELKFGVEMPSLLGAGSEFIPVSNASIYTDRDILKLDNVNGRVLVGYIYGGIESTQPNIFDINTGTQSSASSNVFRVFIKTGPDVGINEQKLNSENIFNLSVYPNPAKKVLNADFFIPNHDLHVLVVYDISGAEILRKELKNETGKQTQSLDISKLKSGNYVLELRSSAYKTSQKVSEEINSTSVK